MSIFQVCEYFQDFDPLRSGSITRTQFRRGLSDLGLSALGKHNLTNKQFEVLCQAYINPTMPDQILWARFTEDIESGKVVLHHLLNVFRCVELNNWNEWNWMQMNEIKIDPDNWILVNYVPFIIICAFYLRVPFSGCYTVSRMEHIPYGRFYDTRSKWRDINYWALWKHRNVCYKLCSSTN